MKRQPIHVDTERRALINLRQLSQITWRNQQKPQQTVQNKSPKRIDHSLKNNQKLHKKQLLNFKNRSQTLDNNNFQNKHKFIFNQTHFNNFTKQKCSSPFTSLTFYQNSRQNFYNTFEVRSKIGSQIDSFISQIKLEQKKQKYKTTILTNQKSGRLSHKNQIKNKVNALKKLKDYLVQSFKIDGKHVNIEKNTYPIEMPGLPTKKSIYFTQFKKSQPISIIQNTQQLFTKVHRYQISEIQSQQQMSKNIEQKLAPRYSHDKNKNKNFNSSFYHTIELKNKNIDRYSRGKLWLGRPPVKIISQQFSQNIE